MNAEKIQNRVKYQQQSCQNKEGMYFWFSSSSSALWTCSLIVMKYSRYEQISALSLEGTQCTDSHSVWALILIDQFLTV